MTNTLSSVVLGLGFALLGAAATTNSVAAEKSNIVFMLADNLGYGELGCYGGRICRCSYGTCIGAWIGVDQALAWCGEWCGLPNPNCRHSAFFACCAHQISAKAKQKRSLI